MRAIKIVNHQLEIIDIKNPDGEGIREIIGNIFTSLFTVDSDMGRRLWGFADDEGLLTDSPNWNLVCGPMLREWFEPIAGPVVIVAGNSAGETVELSEAEAQRFRMVDDKAIGLATAVMTGKVLPVLVYDDPARMSHLN